MFRSKKPKRIKLWVNEYEQCVGDSHPTARAARRIAVIMTPASVPTRVAVPLIELRRGEVVVDVEALVEQYRYCRGSFSSLDLEVLREARKKVGVR